LEEQRDVAGRRAAGRMAAEERCRCSSNRQLRPPKKKSDNATHFIAYLN
jgi:hypothetical protein